MELIILLCIIALYSCLHIIHQPFGVVFDAQTGEYIDSATITLFDAQTNKEVARTISTMDGRYGFFVAKGSYYLRAERTHFAPYAGFSLNKFIYGLPYTGNVIKCIHTTVIAHPISLAQTKPDWNHEQKIKNKHSIAGNSVLMRVFCLVLAIATTVSSIVLTISGSNYIPSGILLGLSALWWVFFLARHSPIIGQIRFKSGKPTPTHIDVLGYKGTLIKRIHTNARGRYWAVIPSGTYDIAIYTNPTTGSRPTLVRSLSRVHCNKGILNKVFFV
jgi:hypothetical protein